jgi:hypothetical protein
MSRLRIIVGGMLSVSPFAAGTALDRLAYVQGLRALGHDVVFVEEVRHEWCRDAAGRPCPYGASVNRSLFHGTMERFGLLGSACQIFSDGAETTGLSRRALEAAVDGADLLLNISGHVRSPVIVDRVGRRAYIDQDPVYTQLWDTEWQADLGLEHHDVLFTTGANIGTPRSPIPVGDRRWRHTAPPVVLDAWRLAPPAADGPLTTIASLGRYADLPYQGRWYRSKAPELLRLAELPRVVGAAFEIALAGAERHQTTVERLRAGGWRVTSSTRVADLQRYRAFIAASAGEIGIAKGAYVEGRAGWIGDRSCHYLAAGRPVLLQSTGLGATVPTGDGLLEFSSLEEAADAAAEMRRGHGRHRRRARELAEAHFSAPTVLRALLEEALSAHATEQPA